MSDSLSPTFPSVRWGREHWQVCSIWRNPIRDRVDATHPNGQNPVFLYRHGGGGVGYDHISSWDTPWNPYYYFRYLLEHYADMPGNRHWDIVSIETAQAWFTGNANIERTISVYMPEAIIDAKRCVSALKGMSRQFGWDPSLFTSGGTSHGATLMMNAQLSPPIVGGAGGQTTYYKRLYDRDGFDSRVRGVLNDMGQIDCRNIGGVDQLAFQFLQAWLGTRTDVSSEWDSMPNELKASISPLAYIQNGDTQYYRPFMQFYTQSNPPHTKPYANLHDSDQLATMNDALAARGLAYRSVLWDGELIYHTPGAATPESEALSLQIWQFLDWALSY